MQDRLFQWTNGCLESNVIALVDHEDLAALIMGADGELDGDRLRTLADRLDTGVDKDLESVRTACVEQSVDLRDVIIAAATGDPVGAPEGRQKEWKKHGTKWFKTELGGRELANKAIELGVWAQLKESLLPFLNALRVTVELEPIEDLADERREC
jgi:putative ATP-dependent endonuclease of OLD family